MWVTGEFGEAGGDGAGEKLCAGRSEKGKAEGVNREAGEERIVLFEVLAEAEAGVEDEAVAGDARSRAGGESAESSRPRRRYRERAEACAIGAGRPRTCIRMAPQKYRAMVAPCESQVSR